MEVKLEFSEVSLRKILLAHVKEQLGTLGDDLAERDIAIQVKSKQNYKSEWESASFRAVINKVSIG